MSRKVLISFLGTAPYVKSAYFLGAKATGEPPVNYVQEAIFREVCRAWNSNDLCLILTTGEAERENWLACKRYPEEKGLKQALMQYEYSVEIRNLNIETGKNVSEIFEIFNAIFEELNEGDHVYFDVTNSFRYLPMLGLVLLNYAQTVKSVQIRKILYGAFETLGDLKEVEHRYPNPADRTVPIFDLTSLATLQEWATISNEFLHLGESRNFEKISGEHTALARQLDELVRAIRTSRGGMLVYDFDFERLKQSIRRAKTDDVPSRQQMERLLNSIEQRIDRFQNNTISNGFKAVEWCIEYELIPQGYTLLQESVRTWLLSDLGYARHEITDYNLRKLSDLALLGIPKWQTDKATGAIKRKNNGDKLLNWKGVKAHDYETIAKIDQMVAHVAQFEGLVEQFKRMAGSGLRNDVNHGGFNTSYAQPYTLKEELNDLYTEFMRILNLNHAYPLPSFFPCPYRGAGCRCQANPRRRGIQPATRSIATTV